MRRRRGTERGVTVVEAAFALPILFMFTFGLVDLGMWTFNSNQATNAARDGARVGVLHYADADVDGSDDHDAIVAAVRDHIPGDSLDNFSVEVECERPDGLGIDCTTARIEMDRIRVDVEWTWRLLTPIADVVGVDEGVAGGSATMTLVGLPLGGLPEPPPEEDPDPEPPATCSVASLTVNPTTVASHSNQLTAPLDIAFRTNASPGCTGLAIRLIGTKNNPTTITQPCGCQSEGQIGTADYGWTYTGSNNIWQSGRYGWVEILNGSQVMSSVKFWVS